MKIYLDVVQQYNIKIESIYIANYNKVFNNKSEREFWLTLETRSGAFIFLYEICL